MKGIECCGQCADYSYKLHKCMRGFSGGTPNDSFYTDCDLPDAEPVKHGRWIENSDPGQNINEHYMCSECGCTFHNWANDNYCPNCGARMDGES